MRGVILDAKSLGDVNLSPIKACLPAWDIHPATSADLISARLTGCEVVLTNKIPITAEHMLANPQLRCICVLATGTNNIDLEHAARANILVCNATGYATPSVVQHTLTLMLNLSTRAHLYHQDVQAGKWQKSPVFTLLHHPIVELSGKTLGIIGYGELGSAVARAAEALGMNTLISERPGLSPRHGRTGFETVLAEADVLSLHCPLTSDNVHLINAERLAVMKPGAFLINTARGGLVDGHALVRALSNHHLGGAAIDVLEQEPPRADDPLIQNAHLENLLITPHNAWGSFESRTRLVLQTRENLQRFLAGKPIRCVAGSNIKTTNAKP